MTRLLFISDLHLCEERPDIWSCFEAFCRQHVRDDDRLFILGDLTEFWIGDDDDAPLALELAAHLRRLADRGVQLAFMRGNRDFLIGPDFCARTGMRLLADPCVIEADGHRLLLTHGDLLCTLDLEYMGVRREFRTFGWQQAFLSKSLAERRQMIEKLRSDSTASKAARDEATLDAVPETAARYLREWGADTLIHGHTHKPDIHHHRIGDRDCPRYVLSDWRPQTRFLEFQDGNCRLLDYPD